MHPILGYKSLRVSLTLVHNVMQDLDLNASFLRYRQQSGGRRDASREDLLLPAKEGLFLVSDCGLRHCAYTQA